MNDGFVKTANKKILNVTKIVTILYLENSSSFVFPGESHDFWEFTYIDKGSMIFTADGREFLLNSGEMVFHKPNEFHKLEARGLSAPNISVVSFVCKSKAMEYFKNKIIKLSEKEKLLLSDLLKEGLSVFSPITERPPVYGMYEKQNAPLGAKQITFNLLEQFLITLSRRNDNVLHRELRNISPIDEGNYPAEIRDIIKFLDDNLSKNLTVKQIAEKFSNDAVIGRYVVEPSIYDVIRRTPPSPKGEVYFTDALGLLAENGALHGYRFAGKRYDAGNKLDYLKANIEFALRDPALGDGMRAYLKELCGKI